MLLLLKDAAFHQLSFPSCLTLAVISFGLIQQARAAGPQGLRGRAATQLGLGRFLDGDGPRAQHLHGNLLQDHVLLPGALCTSWRKAASSITSLCSTLSIYPWSPAVSPCNRIHAHSLILAAI